MINVSKSKVEELINKGTAKEDIRKQLYPELNKNQWTKALKLMGLSMKRVPKVDFQIVDDKPVETVTPGGPEYAPSTQMDNTEGIVS